MKQGLLRNLKKHPLAAVLTAGFIIRLIFLLEYLGDPQWDQLLVDSLFHHRWAGAIADGAVLGEEAFFRAPLYIYIIGFIYWLTDSSLLAARIFGHLVGLAGVAATYLIGRDLFGKRIAVIAGLLHAFYPIAIYFESELLVDSLFTTLLLYTTWFFLRSLKSKDFIMVLICGLLGGLAAITRPVILGLIPIFLLWYYLDFRDVKALATRGILLILAFLIPILPVTIRNYVVADDPVLIASSGGINFYIGNNDYTDGYSASLPPPLMNSWEIKDIEFMAEQETGREMKASDISSFYYRKGFEWILDNPFDFISIYLKKIKFALNNLEISNNRNLNYFFNTIDTLRIIPLGFALIFSLGMFGFMGVLLRKEYDLKRLFPPALIVWYILLLALFFINSRFRLPVVPLIIIFSAYGVNVLYEAVFHSKFSGKTGAALAGGILALFIALLPISEVDRSDTKSALFNRANYQLKNGNYNQAIRLYRELLQKHPGYPDANLNLGAALLKNGQIYQAEKFFRNELRYNKAEPRAYSNLASVYYLRKEYQNSLQLIDKALELRPYLLDAHLLRIRIYYALEDMAALEKAIRKGEQALDNPANLHLEAGIIYTSFKRYDAAEEYLLKAMNAGRNPAETDDNAFNQAADSEKSAQRIKARAAYQLGYLYGIQGVAEKSIDMCREAISLDSSMVEAYINLFNAYREFGKADSSRFILNLAERKFPGNQLLGRLRRNIGQ